MDTELVGGKGASLGELYRELTPQGVPVPNGFTTTSLAYREFLDMNFIVWQDFIPPFDQIFIL